MLKMFVSVLHIIGESRGSYLIKIKFIDFCYVFFLCVMSFFFMISPYLKN